MAEEYTGPERRVMERRKDQCVLCDTLWHHHDNDAKEHRDLVCRKIDSKADRGELHGMKTFVTVLVTITCLVIAGQAIWLRSDIASVKSEAIQAAIKTDATIHDGFATLHRRVSEQTTERERNDSEQSRQLNEIKNQITIITWRL